MGVTVALVFDPVGRLMDSFSLCLYFSVRLLSFCLHMVMIDGKPHPNVFELMYLPARRGQYSHDYPAACYRRTAVLTRNGNGVWR